MFFKRMVKAEGWGKFVFIKELTLLEFSVVEYKYASDAQAACDILH